MNGNLSTYTLVEPLEGMTTAMVSVNPGDGNLEIDTRTNGDQILACGTLQYFEKQGPPNRSMVTMNGRANFTLEHGSGKQAWFRLPWAACNGATVWQVHLNPEVVSNLTAHSDGGNIKLNLEGMAITHLLAETGGGNVEVILPDITTSLSVTVKTGAGNVTVEFPGSVAVRVQVSTGLGKAIIDNGLSQIEKNTYQTPSFEDALVKVEIVASSGAGNVIVKSR